MISADIIRDLALALEGLERSPPEGLILGFDEIAAQIGVSQGAVGAAFARLAELGLIEGPGPHQGAWIFRRLTARGRAFVDEVRQSRDWLAIKAQYEPPPA